MTCRARHLLPHIHPSKINVNLVPTVRSFILPNAVLHNRQLAYATCMYIIQYTHTLFFNVGQDTIHNNNEESDYRKNITHYTLLL